MSVTPAAARESERTAVTLDHACADADHSPPERPTPSRRGLLSLFEYE